MKKSRGQWLGGLARQPHVRFALGCGAMLGAAWLAWLTVFSSQGAWPGGQLRTLGLLGAATLVSEDLTCIGAGVLAAQGRVGLGQAVLACYLGILAGDLLLFLAGRWLGRAALRRAPLKWFVSAAAVERSSEWFARRGAWVILLSRFVPGMRLPTYVAAGVLKTRWWSFTAYFALAAALWTPLLVGLAWWWGAQVLQAALLAGQSLFSRGLLAGLLVYGLARLGQQSATWAGRRRLRGRWRRLTHWEFWPPYVFYLPVVAYILWLGWRHRSLTLFTAANPAILGGGFIGESKIEILRGLAPAARFVARAELLPAAASLAERSASAQAFMTAHGLTYPIVLKPDQGQRGTDVAIIRSTAELEAYLDHTARATLIQEYAPGQEFGVFYYRFPGAAQGHLFSLTEKRLPELTGDGISTLEELILRDERAVCLAETYLERQGARAADVPPRHARVPLVEVGSHCRGALFLDGAWVRTAALEAAFEQISQGFSGFYFGRFDVRTPNVAEFQQGRNFKIVELNGVTSEATHIYDPQYSLGQAYRTLFKQWRLAFEIGARNRQRGVAPTSAGTLLRLLLREQRRAARLRQAGPQTRPLAPRVQA